MSAGGYDPPRPAELPPEPAGREYHSRPRLGRRGRGLSDGPPFLTPSGGRATPYGGAVTPPGGLPPTTGHPGAGYPPPPAGYPGGPGGPGYPGGPQRPGLPPPPPGRRSRRPRLHLRLILPILVVLLVGYPVLLALTAYTHLNRVDAVSPAHQKAATDDTPGRNVLVVGSDSRDDLTAAERRRLHTGKAVGGRTDTIMLLHIPQGGGPTVLVSVPRDSYISIPGHGKNKINAAYAFGGPALLIRTVEAVSGVHIDDYVETGLLGFADIVDAVGGVRICPKFAMNDRDAHINLKKGCQQADGKTALGYARARHSDPRGDLGRVERQREVLAAIASKTLSAGTLLKPWRAFPAAKAGGGALTVDENTSAYGVVRFVLAMRSVSGGNGLSLTVPISNPDLRTPSGSAVAWDRPKALVLFRALAADDTEKVRPLAAEQEALRRR